MRPALDVLSTEDLEEYEIYFYPMAAGRAKQRAPGDTVLLVCADVSFAAGLVRKTTRVLVGAILELSKLDSGMVTPRRSVNDVRESSMTRCKLSCLRRMKSRWRWRLSFHRLFCFPVTRKCCFRFFPIS